MNYQIAVENGLTGHSISALRAEINLGLKRGYGGFAQEKADVVGCLLRLYTEAGLEGRSFLPFVITDSVITYAYPLNDGVEWRGDHEPSLVLTSDKSPLYAAGMSDEQWKEMVEEYAAKLAAQFEQFRVYITYTRSEVKIFQKS